MTEERFYRIIGGCSHCQFRVDVGDYAHTDPVTGKKGYDDYCVFEARFCTYDGNFPEWCPLEEFGGEW